MTEPSSTPSLYRKLESVLFQVNDWLRFAEAKSGALLTFNGVCLFGMSRLYIELESIPKYLELYGAIVFLQMVISASIALISFIPSIRLPISTESKRTGHKNIFYYGDIATYTEHEYLKLFCHEGDEVISFDQFHLDMASQIIAIARIAARKYAYFSLAAWLTLSAFFTPLILVVAYAGNVLRAHKKQTAMAESE